MRLFRLLGFFLFIASSHACELGVYTYDSIVAKGGLGPLIFPEFEKRSGCKLRVIASGDAIQTLSRVEIDLKRGKPAGEVILGVDALNWVRARASAETSERLSTIQTAELDPRIQKAVASLPGFVPYDFGALTFVSDSAAASPQAPGSLGDLLKPEWKRNFILEDPRTSSPGLQFLLFTHHALGDGFRGFWRALRSQWLAMPSGWDAAYGLFLKGQAPLVWSYVTSEAYHREHGSARYRAVLLKEGQPLQLEGALVVRGSVNRRTAREFMDFLLTEFVQDRVAGTNWMWPARKGSAVPAGFSALPKAEHPIPLPGSDAADALKEWSEAIHP